MRNFLNKNLYFVQTIKRFNKKVLGEEMNDCCYRLIKLKAHFRNNINVKEPTNKTWVPNRIQYVLKTSI